MRGLLPAVNGVRPPGAGKLQLERGELGDADASVRSVAVRRVHGVTEIGQTGKTSQGWSVELERRSGPTL